MPGAGPPPPASTANPPLPPPPHEEQRRSPLVSSAAAFPYEKDDIGARRLYLIAVALPGTSPTPCSRP